MNTESTSLHKKWIYDRFLNFHILWLIRIFTSGIYSYMHSCNWQWWTWCVCTFEYLIISSGSTEKQEYPTEEISLWFIIDILTLFITQVLRGFIIGYIEDMQHFLNIVLYPTYSYIYSEEVNVKFILSDFC